MKLKIAFISVLILVLYSCSPKVIPTVAPEVPKAEEVKLVLSPELVEGKNLYENNCAKCHKLYEPNAYSFDQWRPILERMQMKAEISDADREKIYSYLIAN